MKTIVEATNIIYGSKQYTMHGSILEITSYHTGEVLRLDLGQLDEDMLEALQVEEENEEDYE